MFIRDIINVGIQKVSKKKGGNIYIYIYMSCKEKWGNSTNIRQSKLSR